MGVEGHTSGREGAYAVRPSSSRRSARQVDDALAPQGTNTLSPSTTIHLTPDVVRCWWMMPTSRHPSPTTSCGIRVFDPHCHVQQCSQDNDDGARSLLTPSTSIARPSDGTSQPEVRRRAWDVRGGRKRARYGARPRIRYVSPPQETLTTAARVALAQQGTYTPLATPGHLRPPIPTLLDASPADEPAFSWPLAHLRRSSWMAADDNKR
ncbi:hypothetical protein BJ912DRAFT_158333 [Pholiota molesta]|nr:hypothetical protein BJ912DRAFT_158333 [Pholiota molesta]